MVKGGRQIHLQHFMLLLTKLIVNWALIITIFNIKTKFQIPINKNRQFIMGAQLCSQSDTEKSDFKVSYLDYIFGQDPKEGKINHEGQIKSKLKQIQPHLNDCSEKLTISKLMYKDPTMRTEPLLLKSLNNDGQQLRCTYQRPYKFLHNCQRGKSYKIIEITDSSSQYIAINDQVLQYFGVFLCFLADHPTLVEQIILTHPNSYGIHAIQMLISGEKKIIFIDDYILCNMEKPIFSEPIKNIYMWPCLIQKAWLKSRGNTDRLIQKCQPQEVFESFFNFPIKKYLLQGQPQQRSIQLLKTHLYKLDQLKSYLLTSKKQASFKIGISGKKYFYLVATFRHEGKQLFYIRNPCGSFQFRGLYQQPSEKIIQEIRKLTSQISIPQGNFILDEEEFIQQISYFSVVYYSKNTKVTTQSISVPASLDFYIQTQLKTQGNLSLCFRQHSNNNGKFVPITYQMINLTNSRLVAGYENQEGCFGVRNTHFFDHVTEKLPPAKYLIRLKTKDPHRSPKQQNLPGFLIANFPQSIKFDYKSQAQLQEQFSQFLKIQGKKRLQQKNRTQKRLSEEIDQIVFWIGDLVVIYIQKTNTRKQSLQLEIVFPQVKNLECISHKINPRQFCTLPEQLLKQMTIVFQKIHLTQQTELGKYTIEPF